MPNDYTDVLIHFIIFQRVVPVTQIPATVDLALRMELSLVVCAMELQLVMVDQHAILPLYTSQPFSLLLPDHCHFPCTRM